MQTHRKGRTARMMLMTAALFLASVSVAMAQDVNLEGRWGVGLRAGTGMLSQDVASGVEGDAGPLVSADIVYGLENILLLGFNVEWETHEVKASGLDLGDATTISAIPFIEFRAADMNPISPYLSLGLGANFNLFNLSNSGSANFSKLDPPMMTVALKAGIGADYFFTPNMALNAEAGWKYNSGKVDGCIASVGCAKDDWKMSVFSILLGFRYFFES